MEALDSVRQVLNATSAAFREEQKRVLSQRSAQFWGDTTVVKVRDALTRIPAKDKARVREELPKLLARWCQETNSYGLESMLLEIEDSHPATQPHKKREHRKEWKRAMAGVIVAKGKTCGYQEAANWISEHCPYVECPRYIPVDKDGRPETDIGFSVRTNAYIRKRFTDDLNKAKHGT